MAVYFVTGKLGSGKTLCAVGKIRDYMAQGRKVATNLDLNLGSMCSPHNQQSVIRLPDKPRLQDLELLGQGCEEENEDRYGCLVLDELGTWFNSRNWRDKERLPVIDWFLHCRKKHWDVFFIVQDMESLDGQLINALCEHLVICSRTDRLTIPFIGALLKMIGFNKVMPKIHVASVYYGMSKSGLRVDRWWYRAKDLYAAYNTAQIFRDDDLIMGDQVIDFRATFTNLASSYQNHIALKQLLQSELDALYLIQGEKRAARQGGGSLRPKFNLQYKDFALPGLLILLSIIGLTRNMVEPAQAMVPPVQVENSQKSSPVNENEKQDVIPVYQPDFFQKLTTGAIIKVSSYYSDGFTLKAILQIGSGDEVQLVTVDDARSLGYIATVKDKFLTIAKAEYSLTVKLP